MLMMTWHRSEIAGERAGRQTVERRHGAASDLCQHWHAAGAWRGGVGGASLQRRNEQIAVRFNTFFVWLCVVLLLLISLN